MNKNIEQVAYEGLCFEIEWCFDESYRSQALEYYQKLSTDERIKVLKLFKRMGDAGKINDKTKFMYEGDKIYAFKPQPDRFLCFFYEGGKVVVTNAFRKKQQKLPNGEKERAMKAHSSYVNRVNMGGYYA